MASTYHPIYSGLWKDEDLDGASFECKGFFAFLCSNDHVHISGMYRVTDAQLAADTGLPGKVLAKHLAELVRRRRIVRDGVWMFVRGYFTRQPKHKNLLAAAHSQVAECSSEAILLAWSEKYPLYSQWSADRLATIGQRSGNGRTKSVLRAVAVSEQLQSRAGTRATVARRLAMSRLTPARRALTHFRSRNRSSEPYCALRGSAPLGVYVKTPRGGRPRSVRTPDWTWLS